MSWTVKNKIKKYFFTSNTNLLQLRVIRLNDNPIFASLHGREQITLYLCTMIHNEERKKHCFVGDLLSAMQYGIYSKARREGGNLQLVTTDQKTIKVKKGQKETLCVISCYHFGNNHTESYSIYLTVQDFTTSIMNQSREVSYRMPSSSSLLLFSSKQIYHRMHILVEPVSSFFHSRNKQTDNRNYFCRHVTLQSPRISNFTASILLEVHSKFHNNNSGEIF